MTPYTVNITGAATTETLITAQAGRTIKNTSIIVTAPSGAFDATLNLIRGSKTTPLWSFSVVEGDKILDTTPYLFDQASSLSITCTAGVDIIMIGEEV